MSKTNTEKIEGVHRKTDKWGYKNHKKLVCHYSVEILTVAEPACLLFCLELLAVLALQYHPNALINTNLDLATAINYFTLPPWQKHEWKFVSHSEVRNPFSSGRARSGTAGCWPAGAKDYEECAEEADTAPCCPGNMLLSCLHRSCAFQRWNEGQVLSTLLLHKAPGKDTESCSHKDMGTSNRFLVFPALPCCCSYWNFNPAVG